jgi:polysaccharide biosynthesis protein PslH
MNRLKILWLSHFVPYPPVGGAYQRCYHLLKRLGAQHDVHLIAMRHKRATHPGVDEQIERSELGRFCRTVDIVDISHAMDGPGLVTRALAGIPTATPLSVSVYRSPEVRQRIAQRCRQIAFDVIHFDVLGLAQFLGVVGDVPTVVSHMGAESLMIERRISTDPRLLKKLFFSLEAVALRRYERRMCGRFDLNVVVSDDDGRILKEIAPDAAFATVANGVDLDYFRPVTPTGHRTLLFAGRLDQYSNRGGLLHFVDHAWPLVTARYPDVTFHVIGNNPPAQLLALAAEDPRIKVHGFVPDIRPFFEQSSVVVCPLRDGGGTRLKILDALALGVPIVSSTIGCEGIDVAAERHLLIADSPMEFARQIGRLFDEPALARALTSEGRRLIETTYSWDVLTDELIRQYRSVAGHALSRRTA